MPESHVHPGHLCGLLHPADHRCDGKRADWRGDPEKQPDAHGHQLLPAQSGRFRFVVADFG